MKRFSNNPHRFSNQPRHFPKQEVYNEPVTIIGGMPVNRQVQPDEAIAFRNDFFEKYPDLLLYESVVDDVAVKLQASGYRGKSREAVMEVFAKAARQEIARQQQAPPISETQVHTDVGSNKASETTPQNQLSPWKRALKPAGQTFGVASFIGVASFYAGVRGNPTDFTPLGNMLFAGCIGLFIGLGCAAVTFVVAGLYFAAKGEPEVAVQPSTTKSHNKSNGLVWVGVIGFFAILWLIGKNQETKTAQENPNNSTMSQVQIPSNAADAEAQAAAKFRKDFFDKYPDLIPYESVVDAVAAKLQASGYKGESREAVMETFAKEARKNILAESGGNVSASGSEQSTAPFMRASPVNARAGDIDFYDSGGRAAAYITTDNNLTIYLWSGKPCAYLDGEDVYGFNGKHLGWFQSGLIYDNDGYVVAGVADAFRSGVALPPLKGLKQLIPLKSLKELKPLKPPFYNQWSGTPAELFFLQGG